MTVKPLFAGLVVDEQDREVELVYIGADPCYVVDDAGFRRHIPTEQVDRQVLQAMAELIKGHEDLLTDQAALILGQDDIFSRAMIETQLKNIDAQFDQVLQIGLPVATRVYLGLIGFKVRINIHGEVLEVEQPGMIAPDDEE